MAVADDIEKLLLAAEIELAAAVAADATAMHLNQLTHRCNKCRCN